MEASWKWRRRDYAERGVAASGSGVGGSQRRDPSASLISLHEDNPWLRTTTEVAKVKFIFRVSL